MVKLNPLKLVIIVDGSGPKNCWPKGVVVDVMPGKDGQVRKAVVKTNTGTYERPATKLAVLDVKKQDDGIKSSMIPDLLGENVANGPTSPPETELNALHAETNDVDDDEDETCRDIEEEQVSSTLRK